MFKKERQAVTEAAKNVKPMVVLVILALVFSMISLFVAVKK